jgi:hypothetical protein
MKDIKLLELAAKAASVRGEVTDAGVKRDVGGPEECLEWVLWNPLTDNNDAMWLAAVLRIGVAFSICGGWVCAGSVIDGPEETCGDDPEAAMRRVIVRVAAAMGCEMTKDAECQ